MDMTVCNSWFLYVRATNAKNQNLHCFLPTSKKSLLYHCVKQETTKHLSEGDLVLRSKLCWPQKKRKPNVAKVPPNEVRMDHWHGQQRCKYPKGKSKKCVTSENASYNFTIARTKTVSMLSTCNPYYL